MKILTLEFGKAGLVLMYHGQLCQGWRGYAADGIEGWLMCLHLSLSLPYGVRMAWRLH